MIVFGLDAALRRSGFAVIVDGDVDAFGAIVTSSRDAEADRLHVLFSRLDELLRHHKPSLVVIERPGGWTRGKASSSQRTIEVLAASRAAAKIVARAHTLPVVELDVNEARSLILGQTHATVPGTESGKRWVIDLLRLGWSLRSEPDGDEADAIVVAAAGYALWKSGDPRFPPTQ